MVLNVSHGVWFVNCIGMMEMQRKVVKGKMEQQGMMKMKGKRFPQC